MPTWLSCVSEGFDKAQLFALVILIGLTFVNPTVWLDSTGGITLVEHPLCAEWSLLLSTERGGVTFRTRGFSSGLYPFSLTFALGGWNKGALPSIPWADSPVPLKDMLYVFFTRLLMSLTTCTGAMDFNLPWLCIPRIADCPGDLTSSLSLSCSFPTLLSSACGIVFSTAFASKSEIRHAILVGLSVLSMVPACCSCFSSTLVRVILCCLWIPCPVWHSSGVVFTEACVLMATFVAALEFHALPFAESQDSFPPGLRLGSRNTSSLGLNFSAFSFSEGTVISVPLPWASDLPVALKRRLKPRLLSSLGCVLELTLQCFWAGLHSLWASLLRVALWLSLVFSAYTSLPDK